MANLSRVDKSIRTGLSANAVRLLTGEPEPSAPVYTAEKVVVEPEHYFKSAKTQVGRRLELRAKKKAKRRS
jgi:hypothetical protein